MDKQRGELAGSMAKWQSVEATVTTRLVRLRQELQSQGLAGVDGTLRDIERVLEDARGIVQRGPAVLLQDRAALSKHLPSDG